MQLFVDKEAKSIIMDMCNLALIQGGLKNLDVVNRLLSNINLLPEQKQAPLVAEQKVEEPEQTE